MCQGPRERKSETVTVATHSGGRTIETPAAPTANHQPRGYQSDDVDSRPDFRKYRRGKDFFQWLGVDSTCGRSNWLWTRFRPISGCSDGMTRVRIGTDQRRKLLRHNQFLLFLNQGGETRGRLYRSSIRSPGSAKSSGAGPRPWRANGERRPSGAAPIPHLLARQPDAPCASTHMCCSHLHARPLRLTREKIAELPEVAVMWSISSLSKLRSRLAVHVLLPRKAC